MDKYILVNQFGELCFYETDDLNEIGKSIIFDGEESLHDFIVQAEEIGVPLEAFEEAMQIKVTEEFMTEVGSRWVNWKDLKFLPDGDVVRK